MDVYVVVSGGMRNLSTGVLVEAGAGEGLTPAADLTPASDLVPAGA